MITNFSFSNPVKILFGKGSIAKIQKEIPQGVRILMVYGGGSIRRNTVYDQVMKALEGRDVVEFAGIGANPEYETCLKAIERVHAENIGFILAVGGGSVIDAAKFIALASKQDGDLWEIFTRFRYPDSALPLGTILTLPATGSEMNDRAVVTNVAEQDKRAFRTPLVYPQFSVLDPETTYTLPAKQVANGVVDTFVHTTEQYLTYPVGAEIQDRFAESILNVLVHNGERALKSPENYEVRANLMWASTWALNGWIGQGVPEDWASHGIGHELTAFYGLDHAQTLAIVLPGVLDVAREEKSEKLMQLGERVFGITTGSREKRVQASIDAIDEFFRSLGVGTRLSDYGLGQEAVERVVERCRERNWVFGEHQTINADVVGQLLTKRL
jgi:NADP-dependent alcohol dehydrogenase